MLFLNRVSARGFAIVIFLASCGYIYSMLWVSRAHSKSATDDESGHPAVQRQPFSPGTVKPPGSSYSRTLVIARHNEDVTWAYRYLPDIEKAVYSVNDTSAIRFRVPMNKGHEAMVYLTYIIDHYDTLPEIAIFLHGHRSTWHNNDLLNGETALHVVRLRNDRVARLGYMNLRCDLDPGCPNWIHLHRESEGPGQDLKMEDEALSAEVFEALFPGHQLPPVISHPCCAQFAVTAERIRDNPRSTYEHLRNWLLSTSLDDHHSGRVFEYLWHYLFTRKAEYCPSMYSCYCDGYGICFRNAIELDMWMKQAREKEFAEKELKVVGEGTAAVLELNERIRSLRQELDKKKNEAYRRGENQLYRAAQRERNEEDAGER